MQSIIGLRSIGAVMLAAALIATSGPSAIAAKLQGYAWHCEDQKQVCFWHKAVVSPPKGWTEDEGWTRRYQALFLFRNGDKSKSKPVMYVRTHHGDKNQALDDYVRVAQERWTGRVPDSRIEPQPDFAQDGKPGFKVFLYRNPSQPDQAFELTAFKKDVDPDHPNETYFFQVVLVAPSMKEIDGARAAFYELLGRL